MEIYCISYFQCSYVHEWDSDPKALFPNNVYQTLSSEEEQSKKWLRSSSVAHNALCTCSKQKSLPLELLLLSYLFLYLTK